MATLGSATQVTGQERRSPRLAVSALGAFSMTNGSRGPSVGGDMLGYGLRVTLTDWLDLQPWVGTGRFTRPDFECLPDLPCTREGWLLRGGLELPLSRDPREPGLHGAFLGGAGAAFADEPSFTYFVGLGFHWREIPRLAPTAEVRWEQIGGITLAMLGLGLRVDL